MNKDRFTSNLPPSGDGGRSKGQTRSQLRDCEPLRAPFSIFAMSQVTSEEEFKRVRKCSRNAKLRNMSNVPMKVEVKDDPGFKTEESIEKIPPGESVYMCYAAFNIEYSGRRVKITVSCEGDQKIKELSIPAYMIRDNEELLLYIKRDDQNGKAVTCDLVEGNNIIGMIRMNGVIIMMKHAVKAYFVREEGERDIP